MTFARNFAWAPAAPIKDDIFGVFVAVGFMLLVAGLAALILWLRDRSRDWRGVPDWIRERGQIKAQRVGLGYRILWLVCIGIACSIKAFLVSAHTVGFLLLLIATIAFWLVRGDLKIFRGLGRRIDELNRQNSREKDLK
jgi:hypothetical protein